MNDMVFKGKVRADLRQDIAERKQVLLDYMEVIERVTDTHGPQEVLRIVADHCFNSDRFTESKIIADAYAKLLEAA